jgi:hypothetical protein
MLLSHRRSSQEADARPVPSFTLPLSISQMKAPQALHSLPWEPQVHAATLLIPRFSILRYCKIIKNRQAGKNTPSTLRLSSGGSHQLSPLCMVGSKQASQLRHLYCWQSIHRSHHAFR